MARGVAHSNETRAQAVAALLAGQGVNQVSRDFGLPKTTVSRMKKDLAAPIAREAVAQVGESATPVEAASDSASDFEEDVEDGFFGSFEPENDFESEQFESRPTAVGTQKKSVEQLVAELLTANLETLTAQAIIFRDSAWLKSQPAGEVAVLYGVMADKTIRILEAAAAAQPLEART